MFTTPYFCIGFNVNKTVNPKAFCGKIGIMNIKALTEKFYRETPLEKIPWNKTQADFFQKLLNSNKLGSGKALDLGCGVGAKSIALAQKGFKVTGVDIAPTAIRYAQDKAKKAGVRIRFIAADATDLSFLKDEKFDLVLDWASLHFIPKTKRKHYVKEIAKHCKREGKFLLRCFSRHGASKMTLGFLTSVGLIYLFSREDIKNLFGKDFKILLTNRSRPWSHPGRWFDEYLMERV